MSFGWTGRFFLGVVGCLACVCVVGRLGCGGFGVVCTLGSCLVMVLFCFGAVG